MKKALLPALAASAALLATPAMAQTVTGTITLTGSVASKCMVLPGGGSTFGTTIALGELSLATGLVRTDLAATINGNAAMSARVVCTTATPTISVDANPIATAASAATGYANTINFTASVAVLTTGTNNGPFSNASTASPLAATPIGSNLKNDGNNNITITTSAFATPNATDVLVASPTYQGSIVVVISPT